MSFGITMKGQSMDSKGKVDELLLEVYQTISELVRQQEEFDNFGMKHCEQPEYQETVLWLKEKMDSYKEEHGLNFKNR